MRCDPKLLIRAVLCCSIVLMMACMVLELEYDASETEEISLVIESAFIPTVSS